MPMSKDPKGGGTEKDGSKNLMYCSYCFQQGSFTQPNTTAPEMRQFVKGKLREMGFPGFLTGFLTRGIPNLERWRKNSC